VLDVFLGDMDFGIKDVVGIEFRISKLDVKSFRVDFWTRYFMWEVLSMNFGYVLYLMQQGD